eukprot:TRINITY_DN4769_c5_g1_i1.p1 TRINITY_DN4769_c5_g1~~TRINITY_DN4769_c5_g1_i1.p1  ORF type:complete len:817 (+),score=241.29 TRINITY_DN4769_c5_g1_i1:58-2508(+)
MSFFHAHPDFGNTDDDGDDYSGMGDSGGLIAKKQQELSDATAARCRQLESMVKQREGELAYEKNQLKSLTTDFEYNLRLLKERDEELEKYEEAMETMKLAVAERDQESVNLRAQLEYTSTKYRSEQEKVSENEQQHQLFIIQAQSEKETLKQNYESQLRAKDDEIRDMELKLQSQRSELFTEANTKLQEQFNNQNKQFLEKEDAMRSRESKMQSTIDTQQQQLTSDKLTIQRLEEDLRRLKTNETRLDDLTKELEQKLAIQATGMSDLQETTRTAEEALLTKRREEDSAQAKLEKATREKREVELDLAKIKETAELKQQHLKEEVAQQKDEIKALKEAHKLEIDKLRADSAAEISKVTSGTAARGHQLELQSDELREKVTQINTLQLEYHKLSLDHQSSERLLAENKELLRTQENDIRSKDAELKNLSTEIFKLKEAIVSGKETLRQERDQSALTIEEVTKKLQSAQQELIDNQKVVSMVQERPGELERIQHQFQTSESMRACERSEHEAIVRMKDEKLASLEKQLMELSTARIHHPEVSSIAPNLHQPQSFVPQGDLSSGSEYAPVSPLLGVQSPPTNNQHVSHNYQLQLDLTEQKHLHQVSELQNQIAELNRSNQQLSRQNSQIRNEVRRFTEEMAAEPIVLKTKQLQNEVDDHKKEVSSKIREIATLQSQLSEREREIDTLKASALANTSDTVVSRLTSEVTRLHADLEFHKKKLLMYSALGITDRPSHADDDRENEKLRRKYDKLKANTNTLHRENKSLKERMVRAKEDLKRLVTEKNSLLSINNMQLHDIKSLVAQRQGAENLLPSNIIIS